jgi:hypothetical protein
MSIIKLVGGSASSGESKKDLRAKKKSLAIAKRQARRDARAERKLVKKSKNDKELQRALARAKKNKNGFSSIYVEHGKAKTHRSTGRRVAIGFAAFVGIFVLGALFNLGFSSRALPGTFVADINISGLTKEAIVERLEQNFEHTVVNIISGETTTMTDLASLGIEIDYIATAENALSLSGNRSFFSIFNPTRKTVDIVANHDAIIARNLLGSRFSDIEYSPRDAEVVWNADRHIFEVIPSARGRQLSAQTITLRTVSFLSSVGSIDIYAIPVEVVPTIETPDADVIKDYLNSEILGLDIHVPPIANTHSANVIRSIASQGIRSADVTGHQEIARIATSSLIRP